VLLAVLSWADQMRTADASSSSSVRRFGSMSVVLDERQHGSESLLHPGLAKLQGGDVQPACIYLFSGCMTCRDHHRALCI
jgi:hypothetical protein